MQSEWLTTDTILTDAIVTGSFSTVVESGTLKVNSVQPKTTEDKDYIVIAALFSAEGKFQQARVGNASNVTSKQAATGTLNFYCSEAAKDGYYIKTFTFDSSRKITPLTFFDEVLKK